MRHLRAFVSGIARLLGPTKQTAETPLTILTPGDPIEASPAAELDLGTVQTPPAEPVDAQDAALLAIRLGKPAILSYLSDSEIGVLRPLAEQEYLTGSATRAAVWRQIELPGRFAADAAIRMLLFSGYTAADIYTWKSAGITHATILPAPDSCSHCKQLGARIFAIDDLPVTPHPECTHRMGCRCSPIPRL